MDGLISRLLAAIEQTERHAQAAAAGPWRADVYEVLPADPPADLGYRAVVTDGSGGGGGVIDEETAAHIAHHDPVAVLRRCAADRAIVQQYVVLADAPPGTYGIDVVRIELGGVVILLCQGYGVLGSNRG